MNIVRGKKYENLAESSSANNSEADCLRRMGILTTKVGIAFSQHIPFEKWGKLGRHVSLVANSSAWWIGDWLVYGQTRYADRYRRGVEELSLDYQTLRNYAWVARRVEMSRRRDNLSFQHHAEVASLPPDEQNYWLDQAERGRWSRNRLRLNIRAGRAVAQDGRQRPARLLRLNVAAEQERRWKDAAARADQDLADWAASVLDRAADRVLDQREPPSPAMLVPLARRAERGVRL